MINHPPARPITPCLAPRVRRWHCLPCATLVLSVAFVVAAGSAYAGDAGTINVNATPKQTFTGFGCFLGYGAGYNVNYSLGHGGGSGVDALFDRAFASAQLNLQYLRLNIDPRFKEDGARNEIPYDNRALEEFTSQVTMAQKAKAINPGVKLCFSVFRPPHWMRVGEETITNGQGHDWWHAPGVTDVTQFWRDPTRTTNRLRDDKRDALADYLSQFCQRFHTLSGHWPDYLALQNEPDITSGTGVSYSSCTYTPEAYGAVARVVKQRFISDGVPTKLMAPEFSYQGFGGADQEYYKRTFIAAGAPISGQPVIDVGAIHCYGDGFDALWNEKSQGPLWSTEYSFSGRGVTNFDPDLPRSAAWLGAIFATRMQRGHISSFWWFTLMEKAGSASMPEALLTTDGEGGSHIITSHALTRTAYVMRQLATTVVPGSVVQDTEFFWNAGGETYDFGYSATIYPATVAFKRPDGRRVLVFANPTLTTFSDAINLQIPALSAAGTQAWTKRITDASHGDAADGTQSFVNGYAKTGLTVPAQSVITLLEPASAGGDTTPPATPAAPTTSSTTSPTPTLSGITEAGATVTIYSDGVLIGTTTAGADGHWTWTVSPALTAGNHTITSTSTDAANNSSTVSPGTVIAVPAAPAGGGGGSSNSSSSGGSTCGIGASIAAIGFLLLATFIRGRPQG